MLNLPLEGRPLRNLLQPSANALGDFFYGRRELAHVRP